MSTTTTLPALDPHDRARPVDVLTPEERAVAASVSSRRSHVPVVRHLNNVEPVLTCAGTVELHTLVVGQAVTGLAALR